MRDRGAWGARRRTAGGSHFPQTNPTAFTALARRRLLLGSGVLTLIAACGGGSGVVPPPASTRRFTVLPSRFVASQHSTSPAPDGTVVVTGGSRGLGLLSDSIDRMDTATGGVQRIGTLAVGRAMHLATPLRDGGVLVFGGMVSSGSSRAAEQVDLLSGISMAADRMSVARVHHAAVQLGDGRVLVTGGQSSGEAAPWGISASSEVWDPSTRAFRRLAASMHMGRAGHAMSLLPDGRVLVTGATLPPLATPSRRPLIHELNASSRSQATGKCARTMRRIS